MKTILITAYAVNPFKGSEDGTGWSISREIAKDYKTIIITRRNNRPEIERYIKENNDPVHDNMEFRYHDLPNWAMFWKKKIGPRGYVLYFYLWQFFMPFFILRNKLKFNLCHALNFHSDSHPHFLWVFGKPTIWGPIGHHPKMPKEYIKNYGKSILSTDKKYALVKWIMRNLDPFFYLAKWRSKRIIGINSSVQKVLRTADRKTTIIPAVATEKPEITERSSHEFNVLSVGRFTPMKGFDITILSFAKFIKSLPEKERIHTKLTLVGSGESEKYLKQLIEKEGIKANVNIISWVEKSKMKNIYSSADVFLFPSHEGAGMVVPEAMSYGLPVVCFDNVGPGELVKDAGIKIQYSNYEKSIVEYTNALLELYENELMRKSMSELGKKIYEKNYTWETKGKKIKVIYAELLNEHKTIAVFHPSAELYGADRILVNALKAIPNKVRKKVYLFRHGPLVEFIKSEVDNIDVIVRPDMPVIYRKIFTPIGIFKFIYQWFKFYFFLRKERKLYRFQSAYVNTLACAFLLPLLWLLRIKRFVHVHEIIDNPKIIGKITAWLSKTFSNRVVCVSNAVLEGMKRYAKNITKKALVLHNGIDPIPVDEKELGEKINFYLFGRIKPEKGQWYLLEALAEISKEKLANTKFVLMGGVVDGEEYKLDELQEKIASIGLEKQIEIKGFTPNISAAMSKADACLIPSMMKDPFPTTVLEAMSAGKPVITTNHGGAREAVVDGETGFLIRPSQPKEFAETLEKLLERKNELQTIGQKAQERYKAFFTTTHFNQNWLDFNVSNQFV